MKRETTEALLKYGNLLAGYAESLSQNIGTTISHGDSRLLSQYCDGWNKALAAYRAEVGNSKQRRKR